MATLSAGSRTLEESGFFFLMSLKIFQRSEYSFVFLVYAASYLGMACFSFPPIKDEMHY